jgi:phosphomannomutase
MKKREELLEGQSGHLIFLDYNTTGDGFSLALIYFVLSRVEKTVDELFGILLSSLRSL